MNYFDRISYNPASGLFMWVVSAPGIRAGKLAGSVSSHGYLIIKLGRKQYRANRLAWFLTHGEWPGGEVDHIDGDPLNNRLNNLRVVDRAGNSQNRRKAHRDNASGLLGATWNKQHKRWQAKLVANKVRHHLGYFDTPEEAHAAYMAAKASLHIGGCRH
jgi:hypothetical protein